MSKLTDAELTREFDKVQAKVFIGNYAAFFGTILCTLRFSWNSNISTAQTDGIVLEWNPEWFTSLIFESRKTILMHELWHSALLHGPRLGLRDPKDWNIACDIYINNMLDAEGYSFVGLEAGYREPEYAGWSEEEIYEDIIKPQNKKKYSSQSFASGDGGDMKPLEPVNKAAVVNNVVRAMHQQKTIKGNLPGCLPGSTEEVINNFLKPIVNWKVLLEKFFSELEDEDYTWARPNRRHQDIYLPSRFQDEGKLAHLAYFQDVSGSISNKDSLRFNSELAHVWEKYKPLKMSIIQFDTKIQKEDVLVEGDSFTEIDIVGRGGTCLIAVREWIIKHKPTAAIIFTDMQVSPMQKLPFDIPIIWICVGNKRASVPFGKLIHINS